MSIDLGSLIRVPQIHVTQKDIDTFIDPASRARIGATAAQLTGAAAVQQQLEESTNTVLYVVLGSILVIGVAWWLARR